MKKLFLWPAAFFLLLVITFNAEASMLYQVDIDTSDLSKLSSHLFYDDDTYTWTFNIEDLGLDSSQTIESAYLELVLSDDSRREILPEMAGVYFDQSNAEGWPDWFVGAWNISGTYLIDIAALDTLNQDGTLLVTLRALLGDFYVDSIGLNVWATDLSSSGGSVNPVPTPESSTLLLLGLGLLAIVKVIRRKQV
nr:PEP-CTERM sorting domain-containing protein [uncultured Desulfobacter sp.]